ALIVVRKGRVGGPRRAGPSSRVGTPHPGPGRRALHGVLHRPVLRLPPARGEAAQRVRRPRGALGAAERVRLRLRPLRRAGALRRGGPHPDDLRPDARFLLPVLPGRRARRAGARDGDGGLHVRGDDRFAVGDRRVDDRPGLRHHRCLRPLGRDHRPDRQLRRRPHSRTRRARDPRARARRV
ncbi:MAG: hypothetical protein AVDCRST_MAG01-01-4339, partial [uncultured Rubrobacteraceae bacterium]